MKKSLIHLLYKIFGLLPIKNNRIVFSSFDNTLCGGNPRTISDYILSNRKDYEVIWILDKKVNPGEMGGKYKRVSSHSVKKIYYYATAGIWIDSHHFCNRWKRENQFLIQTWHAAIPLKKIEGHCPQYFSPSHIKQVYKCSKMTDYQLSNSDIATKLLREGMWYNGPIVQKGMPVNDCLVKNNKSMIRKLKQNMDLSENINYVLYAPTCRQTDAEDKVNELDYDRVVKNLSKRFGGIWKVLYRGHPIADASKKELLQNSDVLDVTYIQKVQDILCVADIVITDYSSTVTDFMITKKPAFLFAHDYSTYKGRRDFIFPLEDLPFPLAKDNNMLENNIINFDEEKYMNDVNVFFKKWNINETGTGTEAIVSIIDRIIQDR